MTGEIRVANASTWHDVATVMGPKGAFGGCWCTFWRLTNQEIHSQTPDDNRAQMEALVRSGEPVGLVAYLDETPVGWCQVAPRPSFPRLFNTRGLDVDDPEDHSVWSIVCVYVARSARGRGIADLLAGEAVDYATAQGASVVEAYPVTDATTARRGQLSSGTVGMFTRAGLTLAGPTTGRRVVMRRTLP